MLEELFKPLEGYALKALQYAEKYGVIEYKVKGCQMTYYEVYRHEPSVKVIYNLRTGKETRRALKRRPNKGLY